MTCLQTWKKTVKKIKFLKYADDDMADMKKSVVRNFGKDAYLAILKTIKFDLNLLKDFPEMGRVPDEFEEFNLAQYRQIISAKNRIIYQVSDDVIFVHVVCNFRRDLKTLLIQRILKST